MNPSATKLVPIVLFALLAVFAQSQVQTGTLIGTPRFEEYPVLELFKDAPAEPILATAEQRRYGTRIRGGVSKGVGVWIGSWKNPIRGLGPNFAGHYYVIRWGCGSNCLMMAVVDAQTGKVHGPPLSGVGTELFVPMDPMSDVEIEFGPKSSLMVLRNACKDARRECGVYYFNWTSNRFILVKRTLVDLAGPHEGK